MTVEMPDPSQVTLPPANTLRSQLAAHLRAAHLIRGLLRLSEAVADAHGRPALGQSGQTATREAATHG